jgi:hypothetical protein
MHASLYFIKMKIKFLNHYFYLLNAAIKKKMQKLKQTNCESLIKLYFNFFSIFQLFSWLKVKVLISFARLNFTFQLPYRDFISKLNQWNYLKRIQKYIDLSIKEITWKTYIYSIFTIILIINKTKHIQNITEKNIYIISPHKTLQIHYRL